MNSQYTTAGRHRISTGELLIHLSGRNHISINQSRALVENMKWGFGWGTKEGDLVFVALQKHREQFKEFHRIVSGFSDNVLGIISLHDENKLAFMIEKPK